MQSILPRDRARAADGETDAVHSPEEAVVALAEAQAEVARLRGELERAIAERRELVNVVGHELRTPITVIRGYAKLLLSDAVGPLNEEQRRFVEEAARSCGRLDDFVEMLLRGANEERAAMDELVETEGSLAPVLEGAVQYLRPVLEDRNVEVELELDPAALHARFDAARIEQVLTNLIANGAEHAGRGSRLRIHTRAVPAAPGEATAWVEIGVSDDGPGIPEAERAAIFEPYARGASARSNRGLGLGLSICRRIVEAHGGRIDVRKAAEGGCCFVFLLPAATPGCSSVDPDREG